MRGAAGAGGTRGAGMAAVERPRGSGGGGMRTSSSLAGAGASVGARSACSAGWSSLNRARSEGSAGADSTGASLDDGSTGADGDGTSLDRGRSPGAAPRSARDDARRLRSLSDACTAWWPKGDGSRAADELERSGPPLFARRAIGDDGLFCRPPSGLSVRMRPSRPAMPEPRRSARRRSARGEATIARDERRCSPEARRPGWTAAINSIACALDALAHVTKKTGPGTRVRLVFSALSAWP